MEESIAHPKVPAPDYGTPVSPADTQGHLEGEGGSKELQESLNIKAEPVIQKIPNGPDRESNLENPDYLNRKEAVKQKRLRCC